MTRKNWTIVGVSVAVIVGLVFVFTVLPAKVPPAKTSPAKNEARRARNDTPRRSKRFTQGPVSEKVVAIASRVKTSTPKKEVAPKPEKEVVPFSPVLSEGDFGELLAATKDESLATRNEAWRIIDSLSKPEKIHWIKIFSRSADEAMRVAALKATRICFGMENFQRKTKTTSKDLKRRREQAAAEGNTDDSNVIPVSFESLPTKREAVQINDIVRAALKDESSKVKEEAMLAAASFDVETSHTIYQYAMTSCGDDVRLAVLREAEYGDGDFKLRLQMAALDVGGEEVVRVASEGIEKATGKRFANSTEAFEWYEKNRTETSDVELVVPEEKK